MTATGQRAEQGRQDSNLRHSVLETDALPAELRPFDPGGLYPRVPGITARMSDQQTDDEGRAREESELLKAQEHKGYGEDEGERDDALDDEPLDDEADGEQ